MTNLDKFIALYEVELRASIAKNPEQYMDTLETVPRLLGVMIPAIKDGSFNKNSATFRRVCKQLGIKHTYQAIKHFVNEG